MCKRPIYVDKSCRFEFSKAAYCSVARTETFRLVQAALYCLLGADLGGHGKQWSPMANKTSFKFSCFGLLQSAFDLYLLSKAEPLC